MNRAHNFKDVTGQTFGYLTAIRPIGYKSYFSKKYGREMKRSVWLFRCVCGKEIEKTRREITNLSSKNPKSCGCVLWLSVGNKHGLWKGVGEISKTYFNHIEKDARKRNLQLDITCEYIWDLFVKQNRKCALSGEELKFGTYAKIKKRPEREQTASLDRIDSSKGYVMGNVQWVHKRVNFMKQQTNQDEFISWCKKIAFKT
jgi:hypothetical protein